MAFKKLVRYEANGVAHYGDLQEVIDNEYVVQPLIGNPFDALRPSNESSVRIKQLLSPIESTPIIICVGLNYRKHAEEASLTVPKYPVIFTKPRDALAGPDSSISIHSATQTMLDYEGELTVVIGRDTKNLPFEEDFNLDDYVLGYTAGNDLSARNFQLPEVSGGQFCYAKSFDGFAPIGPYIASPTLIPDPQKLNYVTIVNGAEKQRTGTDDMIWSVKDIVRHLSQGTTLRAGTVIMTGTPSGVGYFRKEFLKDGDVVEVEIEGFMSLRNTIKFE